MKFENIPLDQTGKVISGYGKVLLDLRGLEERIAKLTAAGWSVKVEMLEEVKGLFQGTTDHLYFKPEELKLIKGREKKKVKELFQMKALHNCGK